MAVADIKNFKFTISSSDTGPMLRMRMFVLTTVGTPETKRNFQICDLIQYRTVIVPWPCVGKYEFS